ncbi:hypothetical protein IJ556_07970 [bacterium]|nr:hypothetical protein [bacterium]
MAFVVDEDTGNITLVQGDSGEITVNGLPVDKNYSIYFSFYDEKRKIIGTEATAQTGYAAIKTFTIPSSLTDLLKVDKEDEYAIYYYGIKLCDSTTGFEDTVCINDGDIGDLNYVYVYPKKVEGITT